MKTNSGWVASLSGLTLVVLMCMLSLGVLSRQASAQGNSKRGTVVMKGQSVHGGAPKGQGTVTPNGGYYVAPTISCSASVSNMNLVHLADGTQVVVTLEYLDPSLAPVVVGRITLAGGGGSLSTGNSPLQVTTTSKINTMSVRTLDGTIIMSGSVKGL